MTTGGRRGVGADRISIEREPSHHAARVLLPAVVTLLAWGLNLVLGSAAIDLGPLGWIPTLLGLWTVIDAVASFADGADRRVVEVGQDGVWLPDTGYRPWTDFADIRLEPAALTTDVSHLALPRLVRPRRLGFVPRDPTITQTDPPAPRLARTARRVRDRVVAMTLRAKAPSAPLGVNEREIGRRQFERLIAAVGNEVPLGGLDDPALVNPGAAGLSSAQRRSATTATARGWTLPSLRSAIGIVAVAMLLVAVGIALTQVGPPTNEGDLFTFEPEPTDIFEEPLTPPPDSPEPPTVAPDDSQLPGETILETQSPDDFPPPTGTVQQVDLVGEVPLDAQTARLSVRVGSSEAPGPVDVTVYQLGYTEGDPEEIREVWVQLFASEGDWASDGDTGIVVTNSDLGDGFMVRLFGDPGDTGGFLAPTFAVDAGQPFRAWGQVRVSPDTLGGAELMISFFDGDTVVDVQSVPLEPID